MMVVVFCVALGMVHTLFIDTNGDKSKFTCTVCHGMAS